MSLNSEIALETFAVSCAEKMGVFSSKLPTGAKTNGKGMPDRIFLVAGGGGFFVEFKNPNGKGVLSFIQEITIGKLRDKGFCVYVCSDIDEFKSILRRHTGRIIADE